MAGKRLLSCPTGLWAKPANLAWARHASSKSSEVAVAGSTPAAVLDRPVYIYTPARSAMQQSLRDTDWKGGAGYAWRIGVEPTAKWSNPLMGWTSTNDALDTVMRHTMKFNSKENAIAWCEKLGLSYEVVEPPAKTMGRPSRFAGYGDNFSVKRKGVPFGGYRSEKGEVKAAPAAAEPATSPAAAAKPAKAAKGKKSAS